MNRSFPIRLTIADDHPAVILGARYELAATNTITVVATAHDSSELMDALAQTPCDVLVSDYTMPGRVYGDGLTLFTSLLKRHPHLKIVVLTMMESVMGLRALMDLGITCIVSKSDMPNHLTMAIHAAYTSGRYLSPSIDKALRNAGTVSGRRLPLSLRENEVIRLFASGLSVNEIAQRLSRSKKTISTQKSSGMQKLGIARDVDLVRYAIASGLVSDTRYASSAGTDAAAD